MAEQSPAQDLGGASLFAQGANGRKQGLRV
jgi:hypothetical protein